jgi:hypothetical protein
MRSIPGLLTTILLLVAGLALAACAERPADDAEIDVEAPFDGVNEDLIGTWVLAEQAGSAPDQIVTVTFTTTGDYIILTETRAAQYQRYSLAAEDLIVVSDETGQQIEQYAFDISANRLTMTVPGTEVSTVLERRDDLLRERPDLIPPVATDPDPGQAAPPPAPVGPQPGDAPAPEPGDDAPAGVDPDAAPEPAESPQPR